MPRLPQLILLLLAILCPAALAQDTGDMRFATRSWETDEGLPHNSVNAIYQRPDGFLWVATQGGLVRFDGIEFLPRRSPLLKSPRTSRVVELIDENPETLLIACDQSGLVRLTQDGFSVHPLSEKLGNAPRIIALFQEAADVFWVISEGRQVWRWDHGKVQHFPRLEATQILTPGSLAMDRSGTVFLARGSGLERFDGKSLLPVPEIPARAVTIAPCSTGGLWVASGDALWRWDSETPAQVAATTPWSSAPPAALLEDGEGAVWIATKSNGLFRCAGTTFQPIPTSHQRMASLCRDAEGNIWAGTTGGGLNLVQPARFQLLDASAGWAPAIEGGVCEGPPGRIWFANSVLGLRRVSDGKIQPPPDLPGWPAKAIAVFPDTMGRLWFGGHNRVGSVSSDLTLPPEWLDLPPLGRVHAIHVTRDGTVWTGGEGKLLASAQEGKVTLYNESHGYTGVQAQAICEDGSGAIWVGTEKGALFRGKDGRFTRQQLPGDLEGTGIRALVSDADGTLWVGTGGGGLLIGRDGRFALLNQEQGLPDEVVSQLLSDDYGALWFGTSRALFKVDKSELLDCADGKIDAVTPVKFGAADGLPGFSASANYQPSSWKTYDGRLFFVSRKGLVIADPARQTRTRKSPRVHIEKLLVDNKSVALDTARLPSAARKREFIFTAPTFISPEKVRFRYRLDPFESEWNDAGTQRTATYSQLKPGHYRFEVMATNGDLSWRSATATVPLEVVPAWWETWWARMLGLASGTTLLILAVRYWSHQRLQARLLELEATRRVDLERSRIARDLHDGLGASFTQIGMMAEELAEDVSEPEEMKSYSVRLASRVRGIARDLDAAVWTVSPQNDTLAALSSYICQYAIEYFRDSPLRCRVHVAPDIPGQPLSPDARHHLFLTAKEIMNNALKHSGASHLDLDIRVEDGCYRLGFRDDGHGLPEDAETSGRHGLHNIRERVMELGGSVEIQSSSQGTSITVIVPLSK
ncbi:histidine kinase [Luteolibacter arcticus]|uniref:Histidine kinase n=1 Tax=Luteolibacter arcticus TaxID=1581411 RepID=A0ABT3GKI0_9BACT|nr:sensor histidine kinase [Luteolibacter arcticus]MCW1924002.1 histidine kinase [Luteolibacter arcticus]